MAKVPVTGLGSLGAGGKVDGERYLARGQPIPDRGEGTGHDVIPTGGVAINLREAPFAGTGIDPPVAGRGLWSGTNNCQRVET